MDIRQDIRVHNNVFNKLVKSSIENKLGLFPDNYFNFTESEQIKVLSNINGMAFGVFKTEHLLAVMRASGFGKTKKTIYMLELDYFTNTKNGTQTSVVMLLVEISNLLFSELFHASTFLPKRRYNSKKASTFQQVHSCSSQWTTPLLISHNPDGFWIWTSTLRSANTYQWSCIMTKISIIIGPYQ